MIGLDYKTSLIKLYVLSESVTLWWGVSYQGDKAF